MPVQPAQGMLLALSSRLPAPLEKHPLAPDLFELTAELGILELEPGYLGSGIIASRSAKLPFAGAADKTAKVFPAVERAARYSRSLCDRVEGDGLMLDKQLRYSPAHSDRDALAHILRHADGAS